MKQKIKILYLEDNANDAEIVEATLTAGGIEYDILRVETRTDFVNALAWNEFHLILADYKLPSFDGLSALKIANEKSPNTPFIFVTGTMGEETAIETLKSGATDYILKEKLTRFVPTVKKALKEAMETNERKQAEENLRKHQAELETQNEELREMHRIVEESLKKYADLYDYAPVGYFTFDKDGLILEVNLTGAELLGVERDNLIRKPFISFISPEYREIFYSHMQKIFANSTAQPCELRLIEKDGTLRDVSVKSMAVKDEKGASLQYRSVISDITDRKKAEEALRSSEDKFRSLFDQAADLIAILDLQGNFVDLNRRFEEESRWSREEMIGRNVLTSGIVTEESSRHISFYLNQMIQGKEIPIFEIEGAIKDGGTVPYELRATHIRKDGKTVAIQTILRNITERKQATEALETLRKQNLQILQSAGEGILGLDKEGKHTFVNQFAAKMLGYTPDELIGMKSHTTWHHKKRDETQYHEDECPVYKSIKKGTIHTVNDELFWKKDGASFPVEYTSTPIEEKGKIIGAVVTFRDITQRKQMESEIQKRVEDLQDFYEMAIGREIRMKDLKEEMRELKERLEKFEKVDD